MGIKTHDLSVDTAAVTVTHIVMWTGNTAYRISKTILKNKFFK